MEGEGGRGEAREGGSGGRGGGTRLGAGGRGWGRWGRGWGRSASGCAIARAPGGVGGVGGVGGAKGARETLSSTHHSFCKCRWRKEERITSWRLAVQSQWRVACVRIPRFPIAAVWQRAIVEGNGSLLMPPGSDEQLLLPMGLEDVVIPRPSAPCSPTSGAVPNQPSGATSSSWVRGGGAEDGSRATSPTPPIAPWHFSHPPAPTTPGASPHAATPAHPATPVRAATPNDPGHSSPPGTGGGLPSPPHLSPPLPLPHWDALPVVLLDGQRVRAATAAAGDARIRTGMTIAEARSRCASLRVAHWDEETVARAVTQASAAFVQASPQVTPAATAPGTWWIGASGLDALGGETALARRLLAIARRWHPGARVGIADSCVAARAATWATGRPARGPRRAAGAPPSAHACHAPDDAIVIVPPGGCASYLAPAPLGLVPMDEEFRETLQTLGVRTAGAFAALAAEDVERRWGGSGVAAWRLARGEDQRRPVLARLDAPRAVAAELSPSVPTMEPILFLVRAALDRLVQDLVHDGRAAAVVAITLSLDDARGALPVPTRAHTVTREVRLPRPLARVAPLLERCRALLDEWTLPAPVCAIAVAVTATAPLHGAQGELLDPAWRDPAAADAAFARLRSALGTGAIVRPVLRDTHRPDRAGAWERVEEVRGAPDGQREMSDGDAARAAAWSTKQPGVTPAAPHTDLPRTLSLVRETSPAAYRRPGDEHPAPTPAITLPHPPVLRQLAPPERAEVRTADGIADGPPRAIRWRQQVIRVGRAIGPERLTGDWWDAPYARDYWRCEDTGGAGDLVIYRDRTASGTTWYVHGWYD